MQIARIGVDGPDGPQARVVVASDTSPDEWVDLRLAERLRLEHSGATTAAARRLAAAAIPGSLTACLENGAAFFDAAAAALEAGEGAANPEAPLLAPIDPPAYRDFMAYEEHFRSFYDRAGQQPPDVLYEMPVSYMGSVQGMLGPDEPIPWPAYGKVIDYELELGIVIGRGGRNIDPGQAGEHILGFTVFNDFSARDIQMQEMRGRLGPSKGKHFASAVGPRIVTADALDPARLAMRARVNGETWSESSSEGLLFPIAELVAWASTGENLAPGTLLATGTVGGGCGAELERFLEPGDVVELEIEGIGVLRNEIVPDEGSGWRPHSRLAG